MCWNKKVSMATFVLAIIGVIYLYNRNNPNDRWVALFAATIAMIQLAEYFMWSDLACGSINKYASMFALLVLAMEPLMGMVGGIYFSNTKYKNILKYMLFAYLIFIGYSYFTLYYQKKIPWCGTSLCGEKSNQVSGFVNDKYCNLRWLFNEHIDSKTGIIWMLFLTIPFLTMTPMYQGIVIFALGFITRAMSSTSTYAAQGSLWCWLGISVIYFKIIMN